MARVASVDRADLPAEWGHVLDTYKEMDEDSPGAYAPPITVPDDGSSVDRDLQGDFPPLYAAMGNNPPVLDALRAMLGRLRQHAGLSDYHREIAILTLARETNNEYMWNRHVTVSLAGPLSVDELLAIESGDLDAFDEPTAALVSYVRAYASRTVTDTVHGDLANAFDDGTIVGLATFVGCYLGMMSTIDALDISPAGEFVGWRLENHAR